MRKSIAVALVSALLALGATAPAEAATKQFTVKAKFKKASGKTVLLIAKSGRVLASKAITKSTQTVSLKTPRVSSISGASLQLVTTSGGDYYGPVVLSWKSKTTVYTAIKTSSKVTNFGTVTVKSVTGKQGYAKATKKSKKIDKTRPSSAVAYRPVGVGNYGKTSGGLRRTAISDVRSALSLGGVRYGATGIDALDGADSDGDGLPNAFDVNDDGDAVVDSADLSTPSVGLSEKAASCESGGSFRIFTNFKSTQTNFQNNINVYGQASTPFEATPSNIANAMTNTLVMAIQPITQVCGQPVTKTEIKGIGLPYAPADYVDITSTLGGQQDYQWSIGMGRINGTSGVIPAASLDPSKISALDVLMQRVTTASGTYEYASTPGFIFVTHPVPFAYQITQAGVDPSDGSWTNVTFGGDGTATYALNLTEVNTQVNLKVYRPQRLGIDGEPSPYYDLGGFVWTPQFPNVGPVGNCDELRTVDDQMLSDTATNSGAPPYLLLKWDVMDCFTGHTDQYTGSVNDMDVMVESPGPGGNSAQKLDLNISTP